MEKGLFILLKLILSRLDSDFLKKINLKRKTSHCFSKGTTKLSRLCHIPVGIFLVHSYDETVMLVKGRLSYAFNDLCAWKVK